MVYVALLRGINVGGKNKMDMKLLKKCFEQAGMNDVVTYINSGNIIFTYNNRSKEKISHILEMAILENFELQIKVLVLDLNDMKRIMASLPESWANDDKMKSDVLFLWDDMNNQSVMDKLVIKPDIDTVIFVSGAILWSVNRQNVTRSGMTKIIGSEIYQQTTIRNVNTTRKIYEIMLASEK